MAVVYVIMIAMADFQRPLMCFVAASNKLSMCTCISKLVHARLGFVDCKSANKIIVITKAFD